MILDTLLSLSYTQNVTSILGGRQFCKKNLYSLQSRRCSSQLGGGVSQQIWESPGKSVSVNKDTIILTGLGNSTVSQAGGNCASRLLTA